MYKCPECNTPLNESMFCVKCCSKWMKITQWIEEQEEKETIEEAETKQSYIDLLNDKDWEFIKETTKSFIKESLHKTSKQLADEHWNYIEALLKAHEEEYNIKQIEFHYKSAFIHGYKHAMEDK